MSEHFHTPEPSLSERPEPRPYSCFYPSDYDDPLMDIHSPRPPPNPVNVILYETIYKSRAISDEALRCVCTSLEAGSGGASKVMASDCVKTYTDMISKLKATWDPSTLVELSRDALCHRNVSLAFRKRKDTSFLHSLLQEVTTEVPDLWSAYYNEFNKVREVRKKEEAEQREAREAKGKITDQKIDKLAEILGLGKDPDGLSMSGSDDEDWEQFESGTEDASDAEGGGNGSH